MAYIYTDAQGNILTDKDSIILASTTNIITDIPKTVINYKPYIYINGKFVQVKQFMYTNDEIKKHRIFIYKYKNQVPYSIDIDGSVYNDTGYIEGYRLSSNGDLKEQNNTICTGFIPAKPNDIIRASNTIWGTTVSYGYAYIAFYDKNFNYLAHINRYQNTGAAISNCSSNIEKTLSTITTDSSGVITFNPHFNTPVDYAYVRISAEDLGKEMIVTINEEII